MTIKIEAQKPGRKKGVQRYASSDSISQSNGGDSEVNFEIVEGKHEGCDGGLLPAINMRDVVACLKCKRAFRVELYP